MLFVHVGPASELRSCVKVKVAVPNSPSGLCGREVTLNMNLSPEVEQGLRLW